MYTRVGKRQSDRISTSVEECRVWKNGRNFMIRLKKRAIPSITSKENSYITSVVIETLRASYNAKYAFTIFIKKQISMEN
jgi:hypothetical protein